MSILRINEFLAADGSADALAVLLSSVVAIVREARGCVNVELLVDPAEPRNLAILETWDEVASHQAAAKRVPPDMYAEFQKLVAAPPKGRYYRAA